ncbi:hypothetical protein [Herbiconiux daphne]|uniref:Uncharacterized protein n=1 Tax=Herbiconiux daphne TaxID=2970914 RepID=A0ABT2HBD9_9MICO|nr:hypothetical protein [Herbiconiux daphne]MCS5737269.1 hypothetical protein [Herbiconiux daphne]
MLIVVAIVALGYSSNGSNYKKATQFVALCGGSVAVALIPLITMIAVVKFIFF